MTTRNSKPKAPAHLQVETRRWWVSVVEGFELDEHHVRLLTLAAESWDRCQDARVALAKHGTTFNDRFGQPRARPEVTIERDSRLAFARMLRELALDVVEPGESRPARIRGQADLRIARAG